MERFSLLEPGMLLDPRASWRSVSLRWLPVGLPYTEKIALLSLRVFTNDPTTIRTALHIAVSCVRYL